MGEEEEEEEEDSKAVFNMALDTLKRLGKILEEIKQTSVRMDIALEEIQSIKIELVKQLFVQASPLLKEGVDSYKEEVLNLKSQRINIVQNKYNRSSRIIGTKLKFSEKLDRRLNEILIELQLILQKEKYFMPSAEEEMF